MGKLPGFMFYPGDWLKDPELRRCSKAAKGVWMDMLALMFECADRGVFSTGGRPWTDHEIAAAVGGDMAENLSCLEELLGKGVARRNSSGAIFSARMVRDQQARIADRDKKRRQRGSCPDVVPVDVPAMSVSETESSKGFDVSTSKSNTKAEILTSDDATHYVLVELGLGGRNLRQVIQEQVHRQLEKVGAAVKDTAEAMVAAWQLYEKTPDVEFRKGPEKFFSDSTWRKNPSEWGKKSGKTNELLNNLARAKANIR